MADYLQTSGQHTPYVVTQKCGWQGKAYVLPNGDIIRPNNQHAERIIYNGDTSQANAYTVSGIVNVIYFSYKAASRRQYG